MCFKRFRSKRGKGCDEPGKYEMESYVSSFAVDHTELERGIYLREKVMCCEHAGMFFVDIDTWDIRMREPNNREGRGYLSDKVIHTIEHLGAYLLRKWFGDKIVYFGPMGCKTGFYLVVYNLVYGFDGVIKDMFQAIVDWEGDIPGADEASCGNYQLHSLVSAKREAKKFLEALSRLEKERMARNVLESRGKRVDTGGWVLGYYWENGLGCHFIRVIQEEGEYVIKDYEVTLETVGRRTGIEDR